MTEASYLSGRFLLAMPGMFDPNFNKSVIALYVHDENGAFGVGVGHLRSGITFHSILKELKIDPGVAPDCPVHHGGPVQPGAGFVLHSLDWREPNTLVAEGLGGLSSTVDALRAIAEGRGPKRWIVALGYAGWGAGQLDGEMRHHGWYSAEGSESILFDQPAEQRWQAVWEAEGIDPSLLAAQTGNA
ncbi:YqgE/AlgH family protein [Altererythrobacter sp.]|uniref:YqgE/AlgH family protein n=1 Tax=Altererythrobacter sp. TaxID=1872480 RepID=UPI003D148883